MMNVYVKNKVTKSKENCCGGCGGELGARIQRAEECTAGHLETVAADRECIVAEAGK